MYLDRAVSRIRELEKEQVKLLDIIVSQRGRIAELEFKLERLREAVSAMNPSNPFSVIAVQAMVEGEIK